jgi:hypothetical protein
MREATQLASAMLVIVFATLMWVAGQMYIESREIKSVRFPTAPAVQIASIPLLTILPQIQTRSVTGSARQ